MKEYIPYNKSDHTDLNMYQCGTQDCDPGHFYGPAVRDHYLIHYILSGKGIFQVEGKTYYLTKGEGFLICPGTITYYQASFEEPWHYSWVGFHGLKAGSYLKQANLDQANPIFKYDRDDFVKDCFVRMAVAQDFGKSRELELMGLLYLFLSKIIEASENKSNKDKNENRKELYAKKAIKYISMNYSRNISISQVARYIGLDRSYFCSVFKEMLNMSPQEFLINFRINKACELMQNNILSVGDISRSVGYEDPLQFSKIFKKIKGSCPREYKKIS